MRLIEQSCLVLLFGAALLAFCITGYLVLSITNSTLAGQILQTVSIATGLWFAVFISHLILGVLIWPFRKLGVVIGPKRQALFLFAFVEVGVILFVASPLVFVGWGPFTLAIALRILVLPHFTAGGGDAQPAVEEVDPLAATQPIIVTA